MEFNGKLDSFPFEDSFKSYLKEISTLSISPSGYDSTLYLDMAERIVRQAVHWQDETGRIIDPNVNQEWVHTTQRYASSVAPLIKLGRCMDLLESCVRCIEISTTDLESGRGRAHEFVPRDLVIAIQCVETLVEDDIVKRWKKRMGNYDPQQRYDVVTSKLPPEQIHNFAIYGLTGEQMKRHAGYANNLQFIDEHLEIQADRFTRLGMYRDPHCPMTYDLTVRQNLALMMMYQYDGKFRVYVEEIFRRGALVQLFYQSTTGEMPFGGRSNQFHILEGMFCCVCEFAANRYAQQGDAALAGTFKRAAHLAAASTRRWLLDAEPFRHIKNMFGQETLHGCDSYGHLSSYGLLAANLFGVSALIADDSIAECAAPIDAGGYVLPIPDGFHRVFATCGPLHIQLDLAGQPEFDPTGLCRIHHSNKPSELALSTGIVAKPKYRTATPAFPQFIAIGPSWQNRFSQFELLAAMAPQQYSVEITRQEQAVVEFRVTYETSRTVVETYALTPEQLEVMVSVGDGPVRVTVPLLLTDGEAESEISQDETGFSVTYRGTCYRAETLNSDVKIRRQKVQAPNRNGIYDIGVFEREEGNITMRYFFPD
ncbi:hypothetical protein JXJ21_19015 [candidate division KSB1 bacterium]|nr:hypothetical protein [candidate division KSB1 bacterium]